MSKDLKTSDEWQKLDKSGIVVIDADGWNRKNFQYSYYEEKITKEEYDKRVMNSTVYIRDISAIT